MARTLCGQRSLPAITAAVLVLMLGAAAAMLVAPQSALAQAAATDPVATDTAADEEGTAAAGDMTSLVAPIALYPDPILALILQAATQPLDVVQADRFLEKRKKDPKLTPDAGWDKSILGLLNYPRIVNQMNEFIDWTETLGDAVVDQLDAVQAAIQDIRWSAFNAGILASSADQRVTVDGEIIRIMPADPDKVSLPTYDPEALLTAIETEEAKDEEDETAAAAPAPTAAAASAAPAAPAAAPADAGYAAAPAYAPAPYTGPPVVSYGEPESSFWSSAATFAGGAVIGGLLGYGIGSHWFDDDDDDGGGRGISIEDSTIVAGGGRYDRRRVENTLRDRRRDGDRARARERTKDLAAGGWKPAGTAPAARAARDGDRAAKAGQPRRSVRLPNAGSQKQLTRQLQHRDRGGKTLTRTVPAAGKAAAGHGTRPRGGALSPSVSRSETRKATNRGAASRGRGGDRALPAAFGGGGVNKARDGGGLGGITSGDRVKREASRGRGSRDGGGRGRRR